MIAHSALPAGCAAGGGGLRISNLSLALSLRTYTLSVACGGVGAPAVSTEPAPHHLDWWVFAGRTGGELGVALTARAGAVELGAFEAASLRGHGHMPALLTPVPNLSGGSSPFLGASHELNLSAKGYLDPTQPPFSADPTGKADATAALQAAVHYARRNYLALRLPSGEYMVTDTIVAKQTERLDAIDGTNSYWQQARYVPNRWVGSNIGKKPVLVLKSGSFTNTSSPKPVVWYWMLNGKSGTDAPPYVGKSQPNANCNQIFQGIDIRIESNNGGAIGIRARGAQMMVVQDVTIFAGDGLAGLSGGSGSGGSHYGVTVVGGRYGVDYTTVQVHKHLCCELLKSSLPFILK